ncbi:MAG TPA: beta-L-arabinofuranosidase domain-containing protein [Clostridia bacterium]|nr:beta-L-arabinofuranosidase domain-containing protein [Clostridia bacterium]
MSILNDVTRRRFLGTAAAAAGVALLPDQILASPFQDPVLNTFQKDGKTVSHEKVPWKVSPFPMKQVRLLDGPFKQHMEANRRYLHALPVDRLVHTFKINAGLPSSAQPFGGWEAPTGELRGHFTGGHYLSGVALMYASTGDEDLRKKGSALVAELGECQKALKNNGYLSAFPIEFFDRLRDREKVWAPFYTIHKIMAGLLDMYVHAGNEQALDMVEKMAVWVGRYFSGRSDSQSLSYAHMQRILGTEFGGMGEVLANLYAVTGKSSYMETAKRFDHQHIFDPLAAHRDELKGLHANTQIPKVIAAARQYELTREQRYCDIAEYFWNEVVGERCYCTGGTSNEEIWNTDPGHLAKELSINSTECCCAYNMMKLTRHLFGWSADARLMDYYERTMFNHRLGTIPMDKGSSIYYLPLVSGFYKPYGDEFNSFWCCTGSGVEEFAKLNDTIYFHSDDAVYVNLYAASELEWPEKGLRLRQETNFPEQQGTTITISAKSPVQLAINLRIPYWAQGGSVKINGAPLPAFASPTSYLSLNRIWKTGDKIELSLPMGLHIDRMPDDENVQAVMYGPLVLAGTFGTTTEKERSNFDDHEARGKLTKVPDIAADPDKPTAWVEQDGKTPLTFKASGQTDDFPILPLYKVVHERYAVYWNVSKKSV